MSMPTELRNGIEEIANGVPGSTLARAAAQLTEAYKKAEHGQKNAQQPSAFQENVHRAAYAVVRMPATYAACERAFAEVSLSAPDFAPRTVLDLGSGPGTASWAAASVFPSVEHVTMVERDTGLIELGRRLATNSESRALREAEWVQGDLEQTHICQPRANVGHHHEWDIVVASYSLGELKVAARNKLVTQAWELTSGLLIVVEPGTRPGFGVIYAIRQQFIELGAKLAAPCPHANACPMAVEDDWCHFAARLERTAAHRRAKGGDLAYEDEKFSYVAASKVETVQPNARIVRHPLRNPGHVQLTLCTAEGLKRQTIGKSAKELYRAAKKSEWGDRWEMSESQSKPSGRFGPELKER